MANSSSEFIQIIEDMEHLDAEKSHKIEIGSQPLVSVIMTCYNVENFISDSIESILNQTYENLELIIVDDASSDDTVNIIQRLNDPRISLYKNSINCGTYYCKNFGISKAKGEYITLQDADDISAPTRIKRQLETIESNRAFKFVVCQYTRIDSKGKHLIEPRLAIISSFYRKSVFADLGYYDTVRAAADAEMEQRIIKFYGSSARGFIEDLLYYARERENSITSTIKIQSDARKTYTASYQKWHSEEALLYMPFPNMQRVFPVHKDLAVHVELDVKPEKYIKAVKTLGSVVKGSIVSIPSREESLATVIKRIIPQLDELTVYLNGYRNVPDFLINDKILVYRSQDHGDLADNGKFFKSPSSGFHFTFDDDILYPTNYIKTILNKLQFYQYKSAIGVHGIEIKDGFKNYYDNSSREVINFYGENKKDRYIHLIGTGTLAYHSITCKFNLSNIQHTHMVDIYFGLYCQKNNIPLICIERSNSWIKEIETPTSTRIFDNFSRNDRVQTELIKSIRWFYKYLPQDLKDNLDLNLTIEERMLSKLENFGKRLIENEKTIANQKRTILKYQNDLQWYAKTYEHIPKWFLKISGLFRRWPFSKR